MTTTTADLHTLTGIGCEFIISVTTGAGIPPTYTARTVGAGEPLPLYVGPSQAAAIATAANVLLIDVANNTGDHLELLGIS